MDEDKGEKNTVSAHVDDALQWWVEVRNARMVHDCDLVCLSREKNHEHARGKMRKSARKTVLEC